MTLPGHTVFGEETDLSGKRVGVVGLARTGLASVRYLLNRGAQVVGADAKTAAELADAHHEVTSLGAEVVAEFGGLSQLGDVDLIVISPGVPREHPALTEARVAGIEVIGEIELAYRLCPVPMVAITGTNGKGTTTMMTGHMLDAAGIPNVVAGNIGLPVISQIDRADQAEVMVVEVSSFQLETTMHFRPYIAILLNITPDHLDRHADLAEYGAAKARLFRNQTGDDYAILCIDDPTVAAMQTQVPSTLLAVSARSQDAAGRVEEGYLVVETGAGPQRILAAEDMPVPGLHNVTNALAAGLAAGLCGATAGQMAEGLKKFEPADHLLREVVEVRGIKFIDDSKATNTAAAMADLTTLSGPVLVIAGGQSKGADFSQFGHRLGERAKLVCLIGESGPALEAAIGGATDTIAAVSMDQAVEECYRRAAPGDTIVLLPGCASFDMFQDQVHRGETFTRLARQIAQQEAARGQ